MAPEAERALCRRRSLVVVVVVAMVPLLPLPLLLLLLLPAVFMGSEKPN